MSWIIALRNSLDPFSSGMQVGLNRHWLQVCVTFIHSFRASAWIAVGLAPAVPLCAIQFNSHGTCWRYSCVRLLRPCVQVNWGHEEVPLLVHYAGCTVCHPPEGKLSEEVRIC